LFLRREGKYPEPPITFRQLMKNGHEGKPALMGDWTDHLSTLFPEVRIKKVLEVRAADCVGLPMTGALVALFRGLLYDERALRDASELLPKLSFEEHLEFQDVARREGLSGTFKKRRLWEWAKDLVEMSRQGLTRVDPAEAPLLTPLAEQAESKKSLAEEVLAVAAKGTSPAELLSRFAL
jgi:glutamate--cysteine ligase